MAGWWYSVCSLFNWHCIFSLDLMLDDVSSAKFVFTGKDVTEILVFNFCGQVSNGGSFWYLDNVSHIVVNRNFDVAVVFGWYV
ncbi:hypothetical protein G9A89_014748 [Geosiphon pyriformis]|nr:hypothetical protein G9A89_014748 [Geosiphon pyriformis]